MSYLEIFSLYFRHLKRKGHNWHDLTALAKSMRYWLHIPDEQPMYDQFAEQNPEVAELYDAVIRERFRRSRKAP